MTDPLFMQIAGFASAGAVAGAVYFLLLHKSVSLFVRTGATLQAAPLFLARAGTAILLFWVAAQAGPWPLVAAAAGFVAARTAIVLAASRRT